METSCRACVWQNFERFMAINKVAKLSDASTLKMFISA